MDQWDNKLIRYIGDGRLSIDEYVTRCFDLLAVKPDNLEALMQWNIKGLKSAK